MNAASKILQPQHGIYPVCYTLDAADGTTAVNSPVAAATTVTILVPLTAKFVWIRNPTLSTGIVLVSPTNAAGDHVSAATQLGPGDWEKMMVWGASLDPHFDRLKIVTAAATVLSFTFYCSSPTGA